MSSRQIILGPPGTGKTTTLLNILDGLLSDGVPPDRIGYVSFTRKAADEAIHRACSRFNLERGQFPYFRTLHSLCFRQLGLRSGDVLEGKKFQEFSDYARIKTTGRSWSEDGILTGFEIGDRILFMENLARIRCVTLREQYDLDDDGLPWSEVLRVSRALNAYKSAKGLMDYTDMLSEFIRSNIRVKLQVLLVDEAQDLSALQWEVVWVLAQMADRVVIAGDDDQAIYRWAGADVERLIAMDGDVSVLGQSYRCPPVIQKLSNDVIKNVKHRRPKEWRARQGERGTVARASAFSNVDCSDPWVEGSEDAPILVLARNAYVIREQIEPVLRRQGIVYERNGRSSLNMSALRAAESWTRLQRGGDITVGDARSMYEYLSANTGVKRGFKQLKQLGENVDETVDMHQLIQFGGLVMNPDKKWSDALERLPQDDMNYMLAARRRGETLRAKPRVNVSTIHSAKGGQADHVVLMTEMANRTHREMTQNPEDEARVWYVGVTRTRKKITVVSSTTANQCPWV